MNSCDGSAFEQKINFFAGSNWNSKGPEFFSCNWPSVILTPSTEMSIHEERTRRVHDLGQKAHVKWNSKTMGSLQRNFHKKRRLEILNWHVFRMPEMSIWFPLNSYCANFKTVSNGAFVGICLDNLFLLAGPWFMQPGPVGWNLSWRNVCLYNFQSSVQFKKAVQRCFKEISVRSHFGSSWIVS